MRSPTLRCRSSGVSGGTPGGTALRAITTDNNEGGCLFELNAATMGGGGPRLLRMLLLAFVTGLGAQDPLLKVRVSKSGRPPPPNPPVHEAEVEEQLYSLAKSLHHTVW